MFDDIELQALMNTEAHVAGSRGRDSRHVLLGLDARKFADRVSLTISLDLLLLLLCLGRFGSSLPLLILFSTERARTRYGLLQDFARARSAIGRHLVYGGFVFNGRELKDVEGL